MPIAGWLRGYCPTRLPGDLLAGATTAAVVIPQAMAYAGVAGLPVQHGLYWALVPMALYALSGSSRPLSVSTTLDDLPPHRRGDRLGSAWERPCRGGESARSRGRGLLVVAAVLRLGFISDFISRPVLVGFKIGMGLSIAASQPGKVVGGTSRARRSSRSCLCSTTAR